MNEDVAIVVRNLQGKILLVREGELWTIPNGLTPPEITSQDEVIKCVYRASGIVLYSFSITNDYLYKDGICYRVYQATVSSNVTKPVEYLWCDESNVPDNLGILSKHQLRKELVGSLLIIHGNENKL